MAEIKTFNGHTILVDDEDWAWLSQWRWSARGSTGPNCLYAMRRTRLPGGGRKTTLMHRLILGALPGQIVDHANHNTLDNRRANLRFATRSQNSANSRWPVGKAGFRGVEPARRRFRACIGHEGKTLRLGHFPTAEEAARAYDAAALRLFGPFAVLNFPGEGT